MDTSLGLYPRLLGAAWPTLGPAVRGLHLRPGSGILRASGSFRIDWGASRTAGVLARLLRLPRPAARVPTSLSISRDADGEVWHRVFGERAMATRQREAGDGLLAEDFGWLELRLRLIPAGPALRYESAGTTLRLGRWAVRLPRRLGPTVRALESPGRGDETQVRVEVGLPVVGLLVAYDGLMRPDEPGAS